MLKRPDEFRRLKQCIVSTGVEPGVAPAELDDMKFLKLQVAPVDVASPPSYARLPAARTFESILSSRVP